MITELLINGQWRSPTGERLALQNPATEERICEVASASPVDVGEAVEGAHAAFQGEWRDAKPAARAEALYRVAALIRKHQEELAQLECQNIGKPISDARDEIALGARTFEYYAGAIGKFCGQTIPVGRGGFDFTMRQPLGVVSAIVPWNFPFPIACWKVAPALAAGNSVVLKPASISPLTALVLGRIGMEAGLPAGALQVVAGSGRSIGERLVCHPLVRKVSFTGSTAVGRQIMQLASQDLKRVSLELGGKSPNIIFSDADWEQAAESSPMSVFGNAGQDCCARSRIFVERPIYQKFVARFLAAVQRLKVGDPSEPSTQIGPLVSAEQLRTVEQFVEKAREQEREIAAGGKRMPGRGFFYEPTVVLNPESTDSIWQEEVFGPVVCIRPFDDQDSMIREVNASPYGLSGSLWTNDLRRALELARQIESGVLSINSHCSVHVEAPFGGFKQSGMGRDLGMAAMEACTELKNVYIAQ